MVGRPVPPSAPPPPTGAIEEGIASWYGRPFHGRRTASGEVYDMEAATAAHPSLPFGTRVRVHNLETGRATVLRINDRGPFVRGRIIDVSRRGARELGLLEPGIARVRVEILELPGPSR
jgi:rare lipoprotein A